jgi:archaellum biogenesis protein FlaJ (TadC family)
MEIVLKIAAGAFLVMMLFYLWPAFKHWQEHGPKAQTGDWLAAALPLGAVVLLIILLVASVR